MLNVIFIVLVILVLGGIAESIRENRTFQVIRYHVKSPKIHNAVRIVFLSDLHNHSYGVHNEKLLKAIAIQNPDLVMIGGDMIIGKRSVERYDEAVALIRALAEKYPVYCANGNHEQRMKEDVELYGDMYQRYLEEFKGLGIRFLSNQTNTILIKGQELQITGLDIYHKCYTKGLHTIPFTSKDMEACVGKKRGQRYHILLAHNPMYMNTYKEWGTDLVLSGHLHGGVIRIPGLGGLVSPQKRLFPKYDSGHNHEDGCDIIVSRGLGAHSVPIRLFNEPELIVIQLKGL